MTHQEIQILIQQGEGYNMEVKQSIRIKASDLGDEVCVFDNAASSTLLIGVDDMTGPEKTLSTLKPANSGQFDRRIHRYIRKEQRATTNW